MNLQIVAIRDTASEVFNKPIIVHHTAQAVRSFIDETKNEQSELYKHPEDFELWQLATWDDNTGEYTNNPQRIMRAIDVKE